MVSAHRRCLFQNDFSWALCKHCEDFTLKWPASGQSLYVFTFILETALSQWTEFAVFIKVPFILKPCRFDILKKEQFYLHICKHRPASKVVCHSSPSVTEPAEVLTVLHLVDFSSSNIFSAWQEPNKEAVPSGYILEDISREHQGWTLDRKTVLIPVFSTT